MHQTPYGRLNVVAPITIAIIITLVSTIDPFMIGTDFASENRIARGVDNEAALPHTLARSVRSHASGDRGRGRGRSSGATLELLRPRLTLPTILSPGDELEVYFQTPYPVVNSEEWTLRLTNGHIGYELPITRTADGDGVGTIVGITPDHAFCDLYALELIHHRPDVRTVQPNAVKLDAALDEELTFIQITDIHINQLRNGQFDDSVVYFQQLIEEINLIAPDLVFATGDLVDANIGGNGTQETERLLELLPRFEVPFFAMPGNHEYGYPISGARGRGIDDYLELVNPVLDYSFDIGPFHFVAVDTGKWSTLSGDPNGLVPSPTVNTQGFTLDQIEWLQNDLAANMHARQRIVATHAPTVTKNGFGRPLHYLDAFHTLCSVYNVSFVLAGHTHDDEAFDGAYQYIDGELGTDEANTLQRPLYLQTRPGSASTGDRNGYRIIRLSGSDIRSYTYDDDGDGNRSAFASTPLTKLSIERHSLPSGGMRINLTNEQTESYDRVRVPVDVPRPSSSQRYDARNATIVGWCHSDTIEHIILECALAANANRTIELRPVPATPLNAAVSSPTGNLSAVPTSAWVTVDFSASLYRPSLRPEHFYLENDVGQAVPGRIVYDEALHQARFSPDTLLDFDREYRFIATTDLEDRRGNDLESELAFTFRTVSQSDDSPPRITSISPADHAQYIPLDTAVEVSFSEPIDPSTLDGAILLTTQEGAAVAGTVQYDAKNYSARFVPDTALAPFTFYYISVHPTVRDISNNSLIAKGESMFITAAEINYPPRIVRTAPPVPSIVFENTELCFSIVADDPNGDTLQYQWSLDNSVLPEVRSGSYTFTADFESAGRYNLTVSVNDRSTVVPYTWPIEVRPVDRPPTIIDSTPFASARASEGETQRFAVMAEDPDGDRLAYQWYLDGRTIAGDGAELALQWNYSAANATPHRIWVEVSAGEHTIGQLWEVVVDPTNRAPVLKRAVPAPNTTLHCEWGNATTIAVEVFEPDGDPVQTSWLLDTTPLWFAHNRTQVTLNSTALFFAKPQTTRTHEILLSVHDGAATTSLNWTLELAPGSGAETAEQDRNTNNSTIGEDRAPSYRTNWVWVLNSAILFAITALLIVAYHRRRRSQ